MACGTRFQQDFLYKVVPAGKVPSSFVHSFANSFASMSMIEYVQGKYVEGVNSYINNNKLDDAIRVKSGSYWKETINVAAEYKVDELMNLSHLFLTGYIGEILLQEINDAATNKDMVSSLTDSIKSELEQE